MLNVKIRIIIVSVLLLSCICLVSGSDDVRVVQETVFHFDEFANQQENHALCLDTTQDGGFIVLGYDVEGIKVIKCDSSGKEEWTTSLKTIDGYPSWIIQTSEGGYAIATDRGILIYLDARGVLKWERSYEHVAFPWGTNCIDQTPDEGFVLIGLSSGTTSETNIIIITDKQGNEKIRKNFSIEERDGEPCIFSTEGGDIFAFHSPNWIMNLDAGGNFISSVNISDLPNTNNLVINAPSAYPSRDGGAIVCAEGCEYEKGVVVPLLLYIDANQEQVWRKGYSDICSRGGFIDVIESKYGGFIAGGFSISGDEDALVLRTDANGNTIWHVTFGDENHEHINYVREGPAGEIFASGVRFGGEWFVVKISGPTSNTVQPSVSQPPQDTVPSPDATIADTGEGSDDSSPENGADHPQEKQSPGFGILLAVAGCGLAFISRTWR
jgi:hypothetical protein